MGHLEAGGFLYVDDNYGEWFNRLYVRARYWKFSMGVRLDSGYREMMGSYAQIVLHAPHEPLGRAAAESQQPHLAANGTA